LATMFPQARSVGAWLAAGWHVAVAYLIGFTILLFTLGWQPDAPREAAAQTAVAGAE
jgi:hypothetical protein